MNITSPIKTGQKLFPKIKLAPSYKEEASLFSLMMLKLLIISQNTTKNRSPHGAIKKAKIKSDFLYCLNHKYLNITPVDNYSKSTKKSKKK